MSNETKTSLHANCHPNIYIINFSDKRWDLFAHWKFISILKSGNPPNYQFHCRGIKTPSTSFHSFIHAINPPSFLSTIVRLWIRLKVGAGGDASVCARIIRKFVSILSKSLVKQQRAGFETRLPWRNVGGAFILVGVNSAFNRHNRGEYRFWAMRRNAFLTFFSFV